MLYCGDNLFADILSSKKNMCLWRTLLVVRELDHETDVWVRSESMTSLFLPCEVHSLTICIVLPVSSQSTEHDKYTHLQNLEYVRAKMYRFYNIKADKPPVSAFAIEREREKRLRMVERTKECACERALEMRG